MCLSRGDFSFEGCLCVVALGAVLRCVVVVVSFTRREEGHRGEESRVVWRLMVEKRVVDLFTGVVCCMV